MALDDGPPGPRPVCDPVSGRNRDLLERRPENAGRGGLQALVLDRVLCGVVPPRLLFGHHAQTGHRAMGGTLLLAPRPLHAPKRRLLSLIDIVLKPRTIAEHPLSSAAAAASNTATLISQKVHCSRVLRDEPSSCAPSHRQQEGCECTAHLELAPVLHASVVHMNSAPGPWTGKISPAHEVSILRLTG